MRFPGTWLLLASIGGTTAACGSGSGGPPLGAEDGGGGHDSAVGVQKDGGGDAAAPSDSARSPDSGLPAGDGGGTKDSGETGPGDPPFGGSSGGSGGASPVAGSVVSAGSVTYNLIVPSSYSPTTPNPLLVVYSGTEGAAQMTANLMMLGSLGIGSFICAVLDGVTYYGNGAAGATVLDDVRSRYDIDNDRTYLLGESAGTSAALQLGFHLRQSYFAAYWANDVNATDSPGQTAAQLGFQPWGQAGPGGDFPDADSIVAAMMTAGYQVPSPAPYNGAGSGTHGDPNQFVAAIEFFPGKSRM